MQPRLKTLLVFMAATASAPLYGQSLVSISQSIEAGDSQGALRRLAQMSGAQGFRERFLKGTALAAEGRADEAIGIFKGLIEEYPARPEAYNNLAALYARQNRLEEAKEVLEKAIRTHESYAAVYENLSAVYVEMARSSYVKALRLEENETAPSLRILFAVPDQPDAAAESAAETPVADAEQTAPAVEKPAAEPEPATVAAATETPGATAAEPKVEPEQSAPLASSEPELEVAEPPAAVAEADAPVQAQPVPPLAVQETPEVALAPAVVQMDPPVPDGAVAEDTAEDRVRGVLVAWADAWSNQRVDEYIGFYAHDFDPGGAQSREAWEKERRGRIGRPGRISVQLEEFDVRFPEQDRAIVRLLQAYRSNVYRDKTLKRFELVYRDGDWLIRSEKSLKIIR